MNRFFARLAEAVYDAPDFASLLEEGLVFAHRAIQEHEVLRKVLETEPERFLPLITVEQHRVLDFISAFLLPYLEREQRAGRVRPASTSRRPRSTSPASCSRSSARPVAGTWTTPSRFGCSSARSSWAGSSSDLPRFGRVVTCDTLTVRRFLPYCLSTGT